MQDISLYEYNMRRRNMHKSPLKIKCQKSKISNKKKKNRKLDKIVSSGLRTTPSFDVFCSFDSISMSVKKNPANDIYFTIFPFFIYSFQAEDLLDDILSFESSSVADSLKLDPYYSGVRTNNKSNLHIKQEPSTANDAEMHALAKDRQKKDNHNMSKYIS